MSEFIYSIRRGVQGSRRGTESFAGNWTARQRGCRLQPDSISRLQRGVASPIGRGYRSSGSHASEPQQPQLTRGKSLNSSSHIFAVLILVPLAGTIGVHGQRLLGCRRGSVWHSGGQGAGGVWHAVQLQVGRTGNTRGALQRFGRCGRQAQSQRSLCEGNLYHSLDLFQIGITCLYLQVYLLPDKSKAGKRKTKVKKHTLNPIFDETLRFHTPISSLESRTLWLTVWHSDMFGRNDFLGEVSVNLQGRVFDNPQSQWYLLQERVSGRGLFK